jgi:TetR/AcrR family transcriptional repressor of nem operon
MKACCETGAMPDTKRKLLDAAMRLMLRQGFTATTVDQVCAEAKLTKGSFFHYFKSKDEIGEAALEHFCAIQQSRFAKGAFNKMADPLERMNGFIDCIIEVGRSPEMAQGCLVGSLTQELALTHPKIRCQCETSFNNLAGFFSKTLQEAKKKYRPKVDFDPESVATLFVSLLQGSILLAKARRDPALIPDNANHFRTYVAGLFGKPIK